MTAAEAIDFVRERGVVLASAKGPVPRLTEAIVDAPIRGSWWAHPKSHHIFSVLEAVTATENILVCRLVDGKVTLVEMEALSALGAWALMHPTSRDGLPEAWSHTS